MVRRRPVGVWPALFYQSIDCRTSSLDAIHAVLIPLVVELVVCVEVGIQYALAGGGKAGLPETSILEGTSVADSAADCMRGSGWEKE